MACGNDPRSIVDAVGENGPLLATAAVTDLSVLEFFSGFMPALSDPHAPAAEKAARWRRLTESLAMRGVVVDALSGSITVAYTNPDKKMLVAIAATNDDVRW